MSADIPGLEKDWSFVPSPRLWLDCQRAVLARVHARPVPRHIVLRAPGPRDEWIVYFTFTPAGEMTADRAFTLSRLRDLGVPLLIVCASEGPEKIHPSLAKAADALIWKDLSGYDFSGYTIALDLLATRSPGARVCVLNDSVYGPFSDLRPMLRSEAWDFSGFTASSMLENHIQSYAFVIRDLTPPFMQRMRKVFPARFAYNQAGHVIFCQELPMARLAHRDARVGALWYGRAGEVPDPTLNRAFELVDAGFPFLKKSLLTKQAHFADRSAVLGKLEQLGHPLAH